MRVMQEGGKPVEEKEQDLLRERQLAKDIKGSARVDSRPASRFSTASDGPRPLEAVVLALGNTLLTDEGAGAHVLALLRESGERPGVEYIDGGTLGFTLAPLIEDTHCLIVLDATRMARSAGTVGVYVDTDLDAFIARRRATAHEVSLRDLLDIARLRDRLPVRRALVGIEPECIEWGLEPTPAVRRSLQAAANTVNRLLDEWGFDMPIKGVRDITDKPCCSV